MILLSLAFATRTLVAIIGGQGGNRGDDDGMLLGIAQNYLNGRGFSMYWEGLGPLYAFEPPGLPVFHVIFIKLFSNFLLAERIFFVVMSSLTVPVFYLLAEKFFEKRTAFLLALIYVIYPVQWFWSTRINGHTYATNMLVITLYLMIAMWENKKGWLAFLIGVLWASMTFMRPEYMMGIFCMAFGTFIQMRKTGGPSIKLPTLLILGTVLAMAPYAIRNKKKVGSYVLSSNHYSYNLWMVYNDQYTYGGINFPMPPELLERLKTSTEMEQVHIWVEEALKYIKADPHRAINRTFTNLANFWRPWLSFNAISLKENLVYIFTWVPIFILFLIGIFKIPWTDPKWLVIWTFMIYKMAAQIPFYMIIRFREAVFPLFLLIAALPIAPLIQRANPKPK